MASSLALRPLSAAPDARHRGPGPSASLQRAPPQRQAPSRWAPARRTRHRLLPPLAAAADGDAEVAVFRFTLGSDAADALVPRVVGGLGAGLLVLNHVLGGEASDAQVRAEALGAALAAVAIVTPSIEQRLKELQPGRGRQAAASSVAGATSVFALLPGLPEATKQELAWASYALLLNTNICGLAVFHNGRPVMARGLLAVPGGAAGGKGDAASAATLEAIAGGGRGVPQPGEAVYCQDRAGIVKAGADSWAGVPEGAESLLAQPLLPLEAGGGGQGSGAASQGSLLLLSERPRALSGKERAWAAAIAAKLQAALSSQAAAQ